MADFFVSVTRESQIIQVKVGNKDGEDTWNFKSYYHNDNGDTGFWQNNKQDPGSDPLSNETPLNFCSSIIYDMGREIEKKISLLSIWIASNNVSYKEIFCLNQSVLLSCTIYPSLRQGLDD